MGNVGCSLVHELQLNDAYRSAQTDEQYFPTPGRPDTETSSVRVLLATLIRTQKVSGLPHTDQR